MVFAELTMPVSVLSGVDVRHWSPVPAKHKGLAETIDRARLYWEDSWNARA